MSEENSEIIIYNTDDGKADDAQQADKQDEEEIKAEMLMLEEAERQVKLAKK